MKIDKKLISHLENLARLELSEEEAAHLQQDLQNILNMVEKLEGLDTQGVDPLIYISEVVNVWREDEVRHQVSREAALSNAPDHDDQYFRVPKFVEVNQ